MLSQVIEEEAISIIDQSFKSLRSSTAAFKMLLKFKHVHARQAINRHLMKKFNDVLIQYCKEVLPIPHDLLKKCPLSQKLVLYSELKEGLYCFPAGGTHKGNL